MITFLIYIFNLPPKNKKNRYLSFFLFGWIRGWWESMVRILSFNNLAPHSATLSSLYRATKCLQCNETLKVRLILTVHCLSCVTLTLLELQFYAIMEITVNKIKKAILSIWNYLLHLFFYEFKFFLNLSKKNSVRRYVLTGF